MAAVYQNRLLLGSVFDSKIIFIDNILVQSYL